MKGCVSVGESLDLLNNIIEDYMNYLHKKSSLFLDNICFFGALSEYYKDYEITDVECEVKKMNAVDSFNIIKELYDKYYKEEIPRIEELFNGGHFNVFYKDEVEEEKIYVEDETRFCQVYDNINLPLNGDITDVFSIAHEMRHLLNYPSEGRNPSNDILTESLSMFDETLVFDILEEKMNKQEIDKMRLKWYKNRTKNFAYVNFICILIYLKQQLGYINVENYKIRFGSKNLKDDIKNCERILSSYNKSKCIDAHIYNKYVFGIFLASYMHQQYLKDSKFLDKIKTLNLKIKNNENIIESLKAIDLNINNFDTINILIDSLKSEINNAKVMVKKCK